MTTIYESLLRAKQEKKKQLAVLVDPDKADPKQLIALCDRSNKVGVNYFFAGGSLLTNGLLQDTIRILRENSSIPVIIFPGSHHQIDENAQAILLLSLISGRNPDLLIGQHVVAAPRLKASGLEILPTGYMLIDSGNQTTVQYISNTLPIPANKTDIAACTALAGEQLGLKLIFAEAGSGAQQPVSREMIEAICAMISIPLIVGGGIRTPEKVRENCRAGADLIVIGNSLEKDPSLLDTMAEAVQSA